MSPRAGRPSQPAPVVGGRPARAARVGAGREAATGQDDRRRLGAAFAAGPCRARSGPRAAGRDGHRPDGSTSSPRDRLSRRRRLPQGSGTCRRRSAKIEARRSRATGRWLSMVAAWWCIVGGVRAHPRLVAHHSHRAWAPLAFRSASRSASRVLVAVAAHRATGPRPASARRSTTTAPSTPTSPARPTGCARRRWPTTTCSSRPAPPWTCPSRRGRARAARPDRAAHPRGRAGSRRPVLVGRRVPSTRSPSILTSRYLSWRYLGRRHRLRPGAGGFG